MDSDGSEDLRRMFYVYILASLSGTLYVGLTDDLRRRVEDHKLGVVDSFTEKYKVNRLMYFETFHAAETARSRECQIKKYKARKEDCVVCTGESALGRFEQKVSKVIQRDSDVT